MSVDVQPGARPRVEVNLFNWWKGGFKEGMRISGRRTLTKSDFMRAIRGHAQRGKMSLCFKEHGSDHTSARIRMQVTVEGSGTVTSATIDTEEFAETALGTCVKGVIENTAFPVFRGKPVNKSIDVRLP